MSRARTIVQMTHDARARTHPALATDARVAARLRLQDDPKSRYDAERVFREALTLLGVHTASSLRPRPAPRACPRPAACRTHGARAAQAETETIDKEVAFARAPGEHPADRPQAPDITLSLHQRGLEWDPEEIAKQEREHAERAVQRVRTEDVWFGRRQRTGVEWKRHTTMF